MIKLFGAAILAASAIVPTLAARRRSGRQALFRAVTWMVVVEAVFLAVTVLFTPPG